VRWPPTPIITTTFGGSLCHPCITTTHFSYSFLSLKLPSPPCAVLLISGLSPPWNAQDVFSSASATPFTRLSNSSIFSN
jgi:hypothetical protein